MADTPAFTTETLVFTTAAKREDPILFVLDGEEFKFAPQKYAPIALAYIDDAVRDAAKMKSMMDWLGHGLGEEQSDRLLARLQNLDDAFDVDNLMDLVNALVEAQAGRPSGSRHD